jgi:hypothetical protein
MAYISQIPEYVATVSIFELASGYWYWLFLYYSMTVLYLHQEHVTACQRPAVGTWTVDMCWNAFSIQTFSLPDSHQYSRELLDRSTLATHRSVHYTSGMQTGDREAILEDRRTYLKVCV